MAVGQRVPEPLKTRLRPYVVAARQVRDRKVGVQEVAWMTNPSFAQFGEDIAVLNHFGAEHRGFFVDVGAFHPFHISNTALLHRNGWRGVNIEPDPARFGQFEVDRPDDVNLRIGISHEPGVVEFVSNGSFSGIDDDTYLWGGDEHPRIEIPVRPLRDVLAEHVPDDVHIDLLTVDCEGHDFEVITSNDWARFRPSVVLVEHHGTDAGDAGERDPVAFLRTVGYQLDRQMGLTSMMVAEPTEADRSTT